MSNSAEGFGKKIENKEEYRQNASSVQQIHIEGIFFPKYGDRDIRNITRKGLEDILNNLHKLKEYDEKQEHVGESGICKWILKNKINKTVTMQQLREVLESKVDVDPSYFYKLYEEALELQRLLICNELVVDEHNVIKNDSESIRKLQTDIKSRYQQQLFREVCKRSFPDVKCRFTTDQNNRTISVHPLMENYRKYLLKKAIAERTIQKYLGDIRQMCLWFENNIVAFSQLAFEAFPFRNVAEEHLSEYRKFLISQVKRGSLSVNTVSEKVYNIKLFFRYLVKSGHILQAKNPVRRLKSVKAKRYRHRDIPSDEEINRFLRVVTQYSDNPLHEKTAFLLMLCLGLRSFEVSILEWKNINFGTRTITFRGKGGRMDMCPLPKRLYELLLELKQSISNPVGPIFSTCPDQYQRILLKNYKLYGMIAGWKYPGGLHLFRHTFITKLAKKKILPQIIRLLGRHVKTDTTGNYFHTSDDELVAAINKLKYT